MEYKKKYRVKVYAWALMDNHVHFILEPKSSCSLGKLFHDLNTKYVMYYNSLYSKSGRLFGDRFFSSILFLMRNIYLKPFGMLNSILLGLKWKETLLLIHGLVAESD